MVCGGLFEEAAIILRPGLKGIRHTRTMLGSIKNLCTGVETRSASLCFKNRKKGQRSQCPASQGQRGMRLGRLALDCVGSGGQWVGRTDREGVENQMFSGTGVRS